MCNEYNGWANYPTWNVALWIDNDQGLYETTREIISQEYKYNVDRDNALREFVEDLLYENIPPAGMQVDLLFWVLSMVDWSGIVDGIMEE